MPTTAAVTTGQASSIPLHLPSVKKTLEDVALAASIESPVIDVAEVDNIEQDALEVLRRIRFLRDKLAPIERVPPEVLIQITDFWGANREDEDLIALTHVCRAWREIFTSRSSLWTKLDCANADKTRVYLERSHSFPIDLRLRRTDDVFLQSPSLPPHDPFIQTIPHVIGRLKSLSVEATPGNLQVITAHLSPPAPLLEPHHNSVLPTTLFNGDLSSLRVLYLQCGDTELPWRNMANLTSFTLRTVSRDHFSIRQLLDFFENAPRLHTINLRAATPTSGIQTGRLVPLDCLERMVIFGVRSCSPLLDHLVIPVGAKLTTRVDVLFLEVDPTELLLQDHLPRSLDNLKNLSDFTEIHLHIGGPFAQMDFRGPNGQLCVMPTTFDADATCSALESLVRFDTSKTERMEIHFSNAHSGDPLHRALLSMQNLRSLTFSECKNIHILMDALHPNPEVTVCPKLEEITFVLCGFGETFDMENVIDMAQARAEVGADLAKVDITDYFNEIDLDDISELRGQVLSVLYTSGDLEVDSYSEGSGEAD